MATGFSISGLPLLRSSWSGGEGWGEVLLAAKLSALRVPMEAPK